jgi:hypothetical protein
MVFTIKITGIRTATVGDKSDVVKQVEWTMIGEAEGQKFELSQVTELADPNGQPFIPLAELTEANVVQWVEATEPNLQAIKDHIQYVLNKEIAKATLVNTSMPWAPTP